MQIKTMILAGVLALTLPTTLRAEELDQPELIQQEEAIQEEQLSEEVLDEPVYEQMARPFFLYEAPDFTSAILTHFSPQNVRVLATAEGGWLQIETYLGNYWVNTRSVYQLQRNTGIFASPTDGTGFESVIAPQFVQLLDIEGSWIQIETYLGEKWINQNFVPTQEMLRQTLGNLTNDVAIFYQNLETGFTFTHNADKTFFAASLAKTNHALYVYQLAERGYIDINQVHTMTSGDVWGGTGVIQYKPVGTTFTTRELLHYSMVYSDNTAFRMLIRKFNPSNFTYNAFVREVGANPNMIRDVISQNTTARDAALWMRTAYNYMTGDNQFGHYLYDDMTNSAPTSHPNFSRDNGRVRGGSQQIDVQFLQINGDDVMARKWGWGNNSFHEAAIVFADSPYLIVVLTNQSSGSLRGKMADISLAIDQFNGLWF